VTGAPDPADVPFRFDDDAPFDEATDRGQVGGLQRLLGPAPRRVLDLGCGAGRTLVPLAAAGHELIGIDSRGDAVARCRGALDAAGARADLHEADFLGAWPDGLEGLDAVLCLGNTFMLVADPDDAVDLLRRCAQALGDGGVVVIDDIPNDLWPEVAAGNWVSGLSPDGKLQLAWHASDAVFVLRAGEDVDLGCDRPRDGERLHRLWTDGALRLAARAAGLSAPVRHDGEHLLVMRQGPR
jgi:SAM-dependent methyltransferase